MLEQTIKVSNKQMFAAKTILFYFPAFGRKQCLCNPCLWPLTNANEKFCQAKVLANWNLLSEPPTGEKNKADAHAQGVMKAATLGGKSGQLVEGSALWDCIRGRVADWTIKAQSVSTLCLHLSQVLTCTCLTFDFLTMLAICFQIQ